MNDQAQKIVTFLVNGAVKLWEELSFCVLRIYGLLDQLVFERHSQVAGVLVALLLIGIILFLWTFIWPLKTAPSQPGKPPQYIRRPEAYRMLGVVGALVLLYLVACFQASSM
jgi:hypothetical protein